MKYNLSGSKKITLKHEYDFNKICYNQLFEELQHETNALSTNYWKQNIFFCAYDAYHFKI